MMTSHSRAGASQITVRFTLDARSRRRRRRRARPGRARARPPARRDRRAGHRQGRGRRAADHLPRCSATPHDAAARSPTTSTATCKTGCRTCRASPTCGSSASAAMRCASGSTATRLAAYRLTVQDVEDAIRAQNAEIPAGRIESADARVHGAVAETDLRTPEQFDSIRRQAGRWLPGAPPRRRPRVEHRRGRRAARSPAINGAAGASTIGVIKQAIANPLDVTPVRAAGPARRSTRACPQGMKAESPTTRRCSSTARSTRCSRRSPRRSSWSCW